jgi:hypothetical protein
MYEFLKEYVVGQMKKTEGREKEESPNFSSNPLAHTWALWVIESTKQQYIVNELCSFSTVEEFWTSLEKVGRITEVRRGGLALFKKTGDGIRPGWEDKRNATFYRLISNKGELSCQEEWEKVCLPLIGGIIDQKIEVPLCGFYATFKSGGMDKQLWFAEGKVDEAGLSEIFKPWSVKKINSSR